MDRNWPAVALRLLLVALALGAAVAVLSAGAAAQTACEDDASVMYQGSESPDNCHVLGGAEATNNLRVFVADGLIGTQRYESGAWQRQYYTYGGALVVIDGQKTSLGYYHDGTSDDPSGGWGDTVSAYQSPDSQSKSGDTITTVWTVDNVRIEQRVTLPSPDAQFYRIDFDITNTGNNARDIRFLRGEDTYLAGGDSGNGFWNGDTNTIGVTKTSDGSQQRLSYTGITDPVGYRSARYSTVVDDVESGSLENSARTDFHDNGYALEWYEPALAAGDTWTIKSQEGVVEGSVIVSGGGTRELSDGNETFTFNVQNLNDTAQNVSFRTACPTDTNCTTPANRTIAGGATEQVDVTISVPENYSAGTYDIVLTAVTETGSEVEGRGQLVVPSQSDTKDFTKDDDPTITSFDAVADGDTIRVTFESEANPVALTVSVDGPDAGALDREDFSGDIYEGFRATYRPDEPGNYSVAVTDARDAANNDLTETEVDLTKQLALEDPEASDSGGNDTATPTATPTATVEPTSTPTRTGDETATVTRTDSGTPTPTAAGTATPTASPTDRSTAGTETPSGGDGPGLGAPVAIGALLATALVVYRRR